MVAGLPFSNALGLGIQNENKTYYCKQCLRKTIPKVFSLKNLTVKNSYSKVVCLKTFERKRIAETLLEHI